MAPIECDDANERGNERHSRGGGFKQQDERPGEVHVKRKRNNTLCALLTKFDDVLYKKTLDCFLDFSQWFVRCAEQLAISATSFQRLSASAVYPAHVPIRRTPKSRPFWHVCR